MWCMQGPACELARNGSPAVTQRLTRATLAGYIDFGTLGHMVIPVLPIQYG